MKGIMYFYIAMMLVALCGIVLMSIFIIIKDEVGITVWVLLSTNYIVFGWFFASLVKELEKNHNNLLNKWRRNNE